MFQFTESLRTETAQALADCRQLGLEMQLLSGDHRLRAIPLGDRFGIATQGNLLPADKAVTLESLKALGPVAMIGDGLNDAPALATADVGVALGCGADVSRDAAGVCLLSDDLRRFPWSVALARQTVRIVKQNLFWAFAYNIIGIGLAACGRLNPILAALAMALSSVFVIFNSLRLGRFPEPVAMESKAATSSDASLSKLDTRPTHELVGAEP
jgi:P-type E1-E2 ATPase